MNFVIPTEKPYANTLLLDGLGVKGDLEVVRLADDPPVCELSLKDL